ncbi:transposase [Nodularia sp. UHCC 0506]|uniref:transposase n=1 Tax=Nodularia sp. UHCC 0506 TaxID=3110243 RepID=UPI002B1F8722|nr:transposase [Nodularia sp. UHCC 0506]MEA5513394.1 transposase [Nodularia sp. UHCC 0506]
MSKTFNQKQVGIESFYTDSNEHHKSNSQFLRKAESKIKHSQRRIYKRAKGSSGRKRVRKLYAKKHLKVNRRRDENAKTMAHNLVKFNDLVAYKASWQYFYSIISYFHH